MTYHPVAYKPLIAASLKILLTENGELRTIDLDEAQFTPHGHPQSDVTGLAAALGAKQATSEKGQANGYAGLDATGKVPLGQLPAIGGGSADITQVEVDFGAVAVRSKTFTITDALVLPSTQIIATQAGDAPTGKSADDNEMDAILFRAVPGTGQFTLYATVVEGFKVNGFYKLNYLRG